MPQRLKTSFRSNMFLFLGAPWLDSTINEITFSQRLLIREQNTAKRGFSFKSTENKNYTCGKRISTQQTEKVQ